MISDKSELFFFFSTIGKMKAYLILVSKTAMLGLYCLKKIVEGTKYNDKQKK